MDDIRMGLADAAGMNYPAAGLTGYQTALTALFFETKLRGIHPKGSNHVNDLPRFYPPYFSKMV
jgi:hypothetical protein